jgi:uncharacterized membrane protein
MQEPMSTVFMPFILALGFTIGIVLLVLGYRETEDRPRRNRLMGLGIVVIGIMIPVTPISWYAYWVLTAALVLGIVELTIIGIAVILGIVLMYLGARIYTRVQ